MGAYLTRILTGIVFVSILKHHWDKNSSCCPLSAVVKLGCFVPSRRSLAEPSNEPGALELDLFDGIYTSLVQLG